MNDVSFAVLMCVLVAMLIAALTFNMGHMSQEREVCNALKLANQQTAIAAIQVGGYCKDE